MPRADKPHTGCGRVYLATRVGGEHGEVPIFLLPAPRQKINKWVLLRNATGSGPPRPGSPPRGQDWLRPVGTRLRPLPRSKPGTWGLASPPARAPPSPCSLGGYMGRSLGRGGGGWGCPRAMCHPGPQDVTARGGRGDSQHPPRGTPKPGGRDTRDTPKPVSVGQGPAMAVELGGWITPKAPDTPQRAAAPAGSGLTGPGTPEPGPAADSLGSPRTGRSLPPRGG